MTVKVERRAVDGAVEWRAATEGGGGTLTGYAVVFGSLSRDLGGFAEIIEPGAFGTADQNGRLDLETHGRVMARFNHDSNALLGTTDAGTLRLFLDGTGLRYEVDLPDTGVGRDVAALARRGDIRHSSFAFMVPPGGSTWAYDENDRVIRRVNSAQLIDIAPVADPAYWDTTSEMQRGFDLEAIKASLDRDKGDTATMRARIAVTAKARQNTIAMEGI
jgi:HK97 family phage prohead protease